jgi:hypothetical protein
MTPQDHNKVIGIMHLIYGGFNALTLLILVPLFIFMGSLLGLDPNVPGEIMAIFGAFGVFFLLLAALFGIPPLVAGYGMLKRKEWARTASIIASVLAAMSFPFGTALCVYSLWFVFGEGKEFYANSYAGEGQRGALPNASTFGWDARSASQTRQQQQGEPAPYAPPPQPPDWRSDT